jgi:hypothetical protein
MICNFEVGAMSFSRLGLFLIALGAISLVLFFATPVNPNVTFGDLGLLSILGGALFIYLGFLRRRTTPGEHTKLSSLRDGRSSRLGS